MNNNMGSLTNVLPTKLSLTLREKLMNNFRVWICYGRKHRKGC